MSKKDEALKLALECVEAWDRGCDRNTYWRDIEAAVTAIREALAEQPTQREAGALPEGKKLILVDGSFDDLMYWLDRCEYKGHLENCPDLVSPWENFSYEAYTTPQPSKPLTQDMVESCPYHGETLRGAFFDGWIKSEAAHGITGEQK